MLFKSLELSKLKVNTTIEKRKKHYAENYLHGTLKFPKNIPFEEKKPPCDDFVSGIKFSNTCISMFEVFKYFCNVSQWKIVCNGVQL